MARWHTHGYDEAVSAEGARCDAFRKVSMSMALGCEGQLGSPVWTLGADAPPHTVTLSFSQLSPRCPPPYAGCASDGRAVAGEISVHMQENGERQARCALLVVPARKALPMLRCGYTTDRSLPATQGVSLLQYQQSNHLFHVEAPLAAVGGAIGACGRASTRCGQGLRRQGAQREGWQLGASRLRWAPCPFDVARHLASLHPALHC